MGRKAAKARRGRSEGTVTQRADGRWVAGVSGGFAPDGKRIRTWVSGSSKDDVLRKLDDTKRKLGQANLTIDAERTTLGGYLDAWLQDIVRPNVRHMTLESYRGVIRRHIAPHIGEIMLRKITPIVLQRFYGQLERQKVGARTRQLVHVTLATALKRALRLHLLDSNPADGVDAPRVKKAQTTALTVEQMEAFLAAKASHRLANLFIVALTTGMRPGELFGLQWSDVDLKNATIAVRRTIECHNGATMIGEPKTAGSRRRIDIPMRCVRALQEQRALLFREKLRSCEWVFPSSTGTPLGNRNVVRLFKQKLEEANLPTSIRLYDLRHTAATIALVAGIPLKVVSERLGHASIKITADTYQHVSPSLQRDAAEKLDAIFGT